MLTKNKFSSKIYGSGSGRLVGGMFLDNLCIFNFYVTCAQALLDLEVNSDLKAQLRELHITAAKEVSKCHALRAESRV
jgi:hypothetical protein